MAKSDDQPNVQKDSLEYRIDTILNTEHAELNSSIFEMLYATKKQEMLNTSNSVLFRQHTQTYCSSRFIYLLKKIVCSDHKNIEKIDKVETKKVMNTVYVVQVLSVMNNKGENMKTKEL